MIPAILYYLLRRYRRVNPARADMLALFVGKASRYLVLCLLLLLVCCLALPQSAHLHYSVLRKGTEIGTIAFSRESSGTRRVLKLESNIRTRMLFLFTASGKEETTFDNDILLSSSVLQKFNGNERVNKSTKLVGRNYVITKGRRTENIGMYPIFYNMLSLYDMEPVNIASVYTDVYQKLLVIRRIADHVYKIVFPDGSFNEYYYENSVCAKIEVHHSMYRSTFQLKNK